MKAAGRRSDCAGLLLLLVSLGRLTPASAQTVDTDSNGPSFLSAYRFHLNAASIASEDPRFNWDANVGGDIDLVDYGRGRVNFLGNYQVVLGEQLRTFDPNQGTYTLDVSASGRAGGNEVAGVLHHVSRHLSDRAKQVPVDWNALGVRFSRRSMTGRVGFAADAQAERVVKRSFVDYTWEVNGGASVLYPAGQPIAAIASGRLRVVGVDPVVAARDRLLGAYAEGGIRLRGAAGALELFAALERRIDGYPLERSIHQWGLIGFRLVSR